MVFLGIFAFCVVLVFLMLKSEDFTKAVQYVGAIIFVLIIIVAIAASCS